MWQCKKCNFKNSNSSLTCHGSGCNETKIYKEKEIKKMKEVANIKEYRAFCRHCEKEVTAIKAGRLKFKVVWKCNTCKRRFFGVGKAEEVKKDKNLDKQLTVPEDTWDGQ